ncbi:MAG: ribosome maturation factor RimP [Candidatus Latescibacteria bacterium]|jgi:ribosome maturation factor RimP|nr:ribosome maturation factor RimP [Candidatus Latescibacterota bacterium]
MDDLALRTSVEELLDPFLAEKGVELVELMLSGGARRRMLRLYVDRPDGITIGECAALSRSIGDLLDTHDPIDGSYVLEVSSPGLDRPLKSSRDYHRAVGQVVRLIVNGRGELTGALLSCDDEGVVLEGEDGQQTIPFDDIAKANLHFEI